MNLRTLAGVAALIVTTALPAAAETVLRFNNFLPRTSFLFYGVLEPWAAAIGTATDGRVKVEFTATSLGAPPAQFDLVRDGIAIRQGDTVTVTQDARAFARIVASIFDAYLAVEGRKHSVAV